MGVVVARGLSANRPKWMLDRRFFAYRELHALLRCVSQFWSPPSIGTPCRRIRGEHYTRQAPNIQELDVPSGSASRTRVLLSLVLFERPSLRHISREIGVRYESVCYAVNRLEDHGFVKTVADGRDRLALLNDGFAAYAKLRQILRRVAKHIPAGVERAWLIRLVPSHGLLWAAEGRRAPRLRWPHGFCDKLLEHCASSRWPLGRVGAKAKARGQGLS